MSTAYDVTPEGSGLLECWPARTPDCAMCAQDPVVVPATRKQEPTTPRPQGATEILSRAAFLYGKQKLYDYGASRGKGLCIVNGSGGVMAMMDMVPSLRWGWLLETPTATERQLAFAEAAAAVVDVVVAWCFFGWDLDDPDAWRAVLERFDPQKVVAYCDGPELDAWPRAHSLGDVPAMVEKVLAAGRCRI